MLHNSNSIPKHSAVVMRNFLLEMRERGLLKIGQNLSDGNVFKMMKKYNWIERFTKALELDGFEKESV